MWQSYFSQIVLPELNHGKLKAHTLFSTYVPLKMLVCCVWFFDFVYFNVTVAKNL